MEGGGGERETRARQIATGIPQRWWQTATKQQDGTRGGQRREGWPVRMLFGSLSSETADGDVSSTSDWPRRLGRMSCHEGRSSLSR